MSEIRGQSFGIRFVPRGEKDPHICIQLLGEDDEHWFKVGESFSSFWIDDLIMQLKQAKLYLKTQRKREDGFGWDFK